MIKDNILDEILFHIGVKMMCSGTDKEQLIIHLNINLYNSIKMLNNKVVAINNNGYKEETLFGIKIKIEESKKDKLYWRLEKTLSQGIYDIGGIKND